MVANDDLNADVDRARPHDFDRLRMAVFGDEERITAVPLRYSMEHHHRLGGGRRLIEQRCVRDLETRQVDEHRLEIEQRLEPALRSEEHTSELQSRGHLVCRLLLEKKKKQT